MKEEIKFLRAHVAVHEKILKCIGFIGVVVLSNFLPRRMMNKQ
jgi:hypothetical protein